MVLTLADAVPPSVTAVTVGSHVMLNVAGIRIRMSLAAVIVTDDASVTVTTLAVVVACPTVKLWFAAEETVAPALIGIAAIASSPPYVVQFIVTVPDPASVPILCHVMPVLVFRLTLCVSPVPGVG